MDGHQGDLSIPLSRAEAQELLARLLLSHDDDNDLSASLMKRLARALDPQRAAGLGLPGCPRL